MEIGDVIREKIESVCAVLGIEAEVLLEHAQDLSHGDLTTNIALSAAKGVGKAPRELAQEIIERLGLIEGVERVDIAGPGFINFWLAQEYISAQTTRVLSDPNGWGKVSTRAHEVVMVEFTDPNPFKTFHIGHLMSNTIGEAIARTLENAGAKVIRANYQGDVGVHIACALWGMKQLGIDPRTADEFGRAYAHGATAYKEDQHAKNEIDIINKKVYDRSDVALNKLYDTGRGHSLEAFERLYAILGTRFDHYFFESEVAPIGKTLVEAHPEIFIESDGARIFKGEEYGLHTRVFLNSKELPTYEAKELGLEKTKMDLYPDTTLMLVVTANEITEYFKVLKKAMELLYPDIARKLVHVPHGMMKLASGKMSSRTGNVVTGESLIDALSEAVKKRATESRAENPEVLAQYVAVAAIKYQILKQGIQKDITFDENQALSLDGDSGPYLQYAHARARALLRKAHEKRIVADPHGIVAGHDVVRRALQFPFVTTRAAKELAPHHIAQFATTLAAQFNAWYAQETILDTEDTTHKIAVVEVVAATLKNSLHILGMQSPEVV